MHTPAVIPISLKITQQMRCHGPRREMKLSSHSLILLAKPITVVAVGRTIFFILLSQPKNPRSRGSMMARSFVLWLHRMAHQGLLHFLSPQFSNIIWSFAFAPSNPVTCNRTLTLASVLLYPRTLGGGAVHSGWVPFNLSILEQIPPDAKKTPILWAHGIADSTVLFEVGQAGPHFLERAGLSCKFKAYPGLGHPINTEEPHYLESWIRARLQSSS